MEEKQTLLEYENMKKFLQLLKENGMSEQKLNVEFLAGYVDQMESQFDAVLGELKNVRMELNAIQDKTLHATANRAVDKVVSKVEVAKGHLMKLKNHIKDTVDKAVDNFKQHGKLALANAVKSLNVRGLLENIKLGLQHATQSADHGIDNLTKLGNEIHAVNEHLKNASRVIVGKEPREVAQRDLDKGLLVKVQGSLFSSMNIFTNLEQKTNSALSKVEKLEDKAISKKSVKQELGNIKSQQNLKQVGKTRKETERGQR